MGKTFIVDGKNGEKYILKAWYENSRNGFNHKAELVKNVEGEDFSIGKCTAHYINRTWEAWCFKSALEGVLYNVEQELNENIKAKAKALHGVSRMTKCVKNFLATRQHGNTSKVYGNAFDVDREDYLLEVIGEFRNQFSNYNGY